MHLRVSENWRLTLWVDQLPRLTPHRPILTYKGRACTKRVDPRYHGVVYTPPAQPMLLKDEPELGFAPVRMHVENPEERMSLESRINYSKLATIEHNSAVFFVGCIDPDDIEAVLGAVSWCFQTRTSHSPAPAV